MDNSASNINITDGKLISTFLRQVFHIHTTNTEGITDIMSVGKFTNGMLVAKFTDGLSVCNSYDFPYSRLPTAISVGNLFTTDETDVRR